MERDSNETEEGKAQSIESASRGSKSDSFDQNTTASRPNSDRSGNRKKKKPTGMVHSEVNKIRLRNNAFFFDEDAPKLLVIPCLTLEEARDWRGGGYKAVVLAGVPDGIFNSLQAFEEACNKRENLKAYEELVVKADQDFARKENIAIRLGI